MYVPQIYKEEDQGKLLAFIEAHSFGILVTSDDGVPFATHLPFVLDKGRGEQGVLVSHLARANLQWHHFQTGTKALVIFHGPHAYVSPTWYTDEFNVPTWNYVAVHVYGTVCMVEDGAAVARILDQMVAVYEGQDPHAWSVPWHDVRYGKLTGGVVAFEIEISRLEGKAKLSQNKSAADRRGVVQHLQDAADPHQLAIAHMMSSQLQDKDNDEDV